MDYKILFSKYCRAKGTDANEGLFKKQADIMMRLPLLIGSTIDPCQILLILFINYTDVFKYRMTAGLMGWIMVYGLYA